MRRRTVIAAALLPQQQQQQQQHDDSEHVRARPARPHRRPVTLIGFNVGTQPDSRRTSVS